MGLDSFTRAHACKLSCSRPARACKNSARTTRLPTCFRDLPCVCASLHASRVPSACTYSHFYKAAPFIHCGFMARAHKRANAHMSHIRLQARLLTCRHLLCVAVRSFSYSECAAPATWPVHECHMPSHACSCCSDRTGVETRRRIQRGRSPGNLQNL